MAFEIFGIYSNGNLFGDLLGTGPPSISLVKDIDAYLLRYRDI